MSSVSHPILHDFEGIRSRNLANNALSLRFVFVFVFLFSYSGGWGKIKLELTTLARIFHTTRHLFVDLTQLH